MATPTNPYQSRGAGGKFSKKPLRHSIPATPYTRSPTTSVRKHNPRSILKKLVDSASRLIYAGAGRLFGVFRKSLPPPSLRLSESSKQPHNIVQKQGQSGFIAAATGLAELEQMLEQKTFTRSKVKRLTLLLHSKTINSPSDELQEQHGDKSLHAALTSTPIVTSRVHEEITSPAELAKYYMGSKPTSQAPRQNSKLFPTIPMTRVAQKTVISLRNLDNGVTPRSRGRSALHTMARRPYSGSPSTYSQQALKRGSSILDDDIGSGISLRRIRQKANLLSQRKKKELGYHVFQQPDAAVPNLLLTNGPATKVLDYASVPLKSTQTVNKILQHLDIPRPKPGPIEKGSVSTLAGMREKSPNKLKLYMLHGQALRSMETADSPKFLPSYHDIQKPVESELTFQSKSETVESRLNNVPAPQHGDHKRDNVDAVVATSIPGVISTVLEAETAELPKYYMEPRPTSPKQDPNLLPASPVAQKTTNTLTTHGNGYVTRTSRGRSAMYIMARIPSTSSHQTLKRRSSLLDDDIGFGSSHHRIRQRANLLSPTEKKEIMCPVFQQPDGVVPDLLRNGSMPKVPNCASIPVETELTSQSKNKTEESGLEKLPAPQNIVTSVNVDETITKTSKDKAPAAEITDLPLKVTEEPKKRPAFQMSALEGSFEIDDDEHGVHDNGHVLSPLLENIKPDTFTANIIKTPALPEASGIPNLVKNNKPVFCEVLKVSEQAKLKEDENDISTPKTNFGSFGDSVIEQGLGFKILVSSPASSSVTAPQTSVITPSTLEIEKIEPEKMSPSLFSAKERLESRPDTGSDPNENGSISEFKSAAKNDHVQFLTSNKSEKGNWNENGNRDDRKSESLFSTVLAATSTNGTFSFGTSAATSSTIMSVGSSLFGFSSSAATISTTTTTGSSLFSYSSQAVATSTTTTGNVLFSFSSQAALTSTTTVTRSSLSSFNSPAVATSTTTSQSHGSFFIMTNASSSGTLFRSSSPAFTSLPSFGITTVRPTSETKPNNFTCGSTTSKFGSTWQQPQNSSGFGSALSPPSQSVFTFWPSSTPTPSFTTAGTSNSSFRGPYVFGNSIPFFGAIPTLPNKNNHQMSMDDNMDEDSNPTQNNVTPFGQAPVNAPGFMLGSATLTQPHRWFHSNFSAAPSFGITSVGPTSETKPINSNSGSTASIFGSTWQQPQKPSGFSSTFSSSSGFTFWPSSTPVPSFVTDGVSNSSCCGFSTFVNSAPVFGAVNDQMSIEDSMDDDSMPTKRSMEDSMDEDRECTSGNVRFSQPTRWWI